MEYHTSVKQPHGDTNFVAKDVSGKLVPSQNRTTMFSKDTSYVALMVPYVKAADGYGLIEVPKNAFSSSGKSLLNDCVNYDITLGDAHRKYNIKYVDKEGNNCENLASASHIYNYFGFNKQAYIDGFTFENEEYHSNLTDNSFDRALKSNLENLEISNMSKDQKAFFDKMFVSSTHGTDILNQFNVCAHDALGSYYFESQGNDATFDVTAFCRDCLSYYDTLSEDMKNNFESYRNCFSDSLGVCFNDLGSKKYKDMYKNSFIDGYISSLKVKTIGMGLAMYCDVRGLSNEECARSIDRVQNKTYNERVLRSVCDFVTTRRGHYSNSEMTANYERIFYRSYSAPNGSDDYTILNSCKHAVEWSRCKAEGKEYSSGCQRYSSTDHNDNFFEIPEDMEDDLPFS